MRSSGEKTASSASATTPVGPESTTRRAEVVLTITASGGGGSSPTTSKVRVKRATAPAGGTEALARGKPETQLQPAIAATRSPATDQRVLVARMAGKAA